MAGSPAGAVVAAAATSSEFVIMGNRIVVAPRSVIGGRVQLASPPVGGDAPRRFHPRGDDARVTGPYRSRCERARLKGSAAPAPRVRPARDDGRLRHRGDDEAGAGPARGRLAGGARARPLSGRALDARAGPRRGRRFADRLSPPRGRGGFLLTIV